MLKLASLLALPVLVLGCNNTPAVAAPGDVAPAAPATSEPTPSIVRDADGDGVPDTADKSCAELSESTCKITAGCAWTDAGACVDE